MKRKISAILLLFIIVTSSVIIMSCKKDEKPTLTYVVTYKIRHSLDLTEEINIEYNEHIIHLAPSDTMDWSASLQWPSCKTVTLRADVQNHQNHPVWVYGEILSNGKLLCSDSLYANGSAYIYCGETLPSN